MSSCQWASYIQETLENIAGTKSSVIEYVIPENIDTFYKIPEYYNNQVSPDKIRQEFQDYNKKLCPNKALSKTITQLPPPSRWCQTPPQRTVMPFKRENLKQACQTVSLSPMNV